MGALCCGLPILIGLAILYARMPRLRRGIAVTVAVGGCLFALGIGTALYVSIRDQPVIDAVLDHDPLALRRALDAGGSPDAGAGDDASLSALMLAIDEGDLPCVELLLRYGADTNETSVGGSPRLAARQRGRTGILHLLERYGAE